MRRGMMFGCIALMVAGCTPPAGPESEATESPVVANPPPAQIAHVGVGQQGRSLDNEQGIGKIFSGPATAYFNAKEKIAFEIAVPHALSLYQAEKGEYPKSHEEFMQNIIGFNQIALPKLPPGVQYRYHADDHQLWVEPIGAEENSLPGSETTPPLDTGSN